MELKLWARRSTRAFDSILAIAMPVPTVAERRASATFACAAVDGWSPSRRERTRPPGGNRAHDCLDFAQDGAVEDEAHDRLMGQQTGAPCLLIALHFAPDPADGVLADR